MNLSRLYRRTLHKPLKTYWWRYDYPRKLNFGDELTPFLIERLFGLRTSWADPSQCEVAGAGSIIELLQKLSNEHRVAIWGSGFIQPGKANDATNLRFSAVRGKLTLKRTGLQDIALGDPGLITPLAFPVKPAKKYKLGIIPHYVDQDAKVLRKLQDRRHIKIINVLDSVETVVKDINSCDLILSSSLHGLILSDAYGIPNYWMPLSKGLTGGNYKFRDYYSVFDLEPMIIAPQDFKQQQLDQLINEYVSRPGLGKIQEKLIGAFPF